MTKFFWAFVICVCLSKEIFVIAKGRDRRKGIYFPSKTESDSLREKNDDSLKKGGSK